MSRKRNRKKPNPALPDAESPVRMGLLAGERLSPGSEGTFLVLSDIAKMVMDPKPDSNIKALMAMAKRDTPEAMVELLTDVHDIMAPAVGSAMGGGSWQWESLSKKTEENKRKFEKVGLDQRKTVWSVRMAARRAKLCCRNPDGFPDTLQSRRKQHEQSLYLLLSRAAKAVGCKLFKDVTDVKKINLGGLNQFKLLEIDDDKEELRTRFKLAGLMDSQSVMFKTPRLQCVVRSDGVVMFRPLDEMVK